MKHNVRIRVDHREQDLFQCFESFSGDGVEIKKESLECGDVSLECDAESFSLCFLFERKTFADLAASIKDGRYKEQKARMVSMCPPHRITYLIEEMPSMSALSSTHFGLSRSVFEGAILNTLYRDGIHVVFMDTVQDTAHWIYTMAQKISQHPETFHGTTQSSDTYADCLQKFKTRRIENITPDHCFLMQLCQIPTISKHLATALIDKFKTFQQLYAILTPLPPAERLQAFTSVPKIGAKKAKLIHDFLFHESAST